MKLKEYDLDKHEQRSIPTLGLCIYCGLTLPPEELTDEHVIPYALGHNTLIFRKASCKACANIIQRYEQEVLKKQWGTFRLQIDAPSRTKRKYRAKSVDLAFIEVDDYGKPIRDLGTRSFSLDDAPLTLSLWQLPEPNIILPDNERSASGGRPWFKTDEDLVHKINRQVATETGSNHVAMKIAEVNRSHFLRFLAKTAHAFVVAELGIEGFKPFLNDIILNRSDDLSNYVGGTFPPEPHEVDPANSTFMSIGGTDNFLAVRLQFWSALSTPAFAIVVGEPHENTEDRIQAMIARYS